jgi:sigma-B regulation protein RsbU (phosphoserine phosphatase)
MARFTRLNLFVSIILAYGISLPAQAPASNLDSANPRRFDASSLGARVVLGPQWLFSADDNPAFASPSYDDTGWKTVSTDEPLASFGIHNKPYVWYRIHVHVSPNDRSLAAEVQSIRGSYELFVNGVRIGANGQMNNLILSTQFYLTAYDIPDSIIAPNGDLVIAVRFALNRAGPNNRGSSTPFFTGGVLLASRDAAQRDASYESTHQALFPLMLCALNFMVGLVALALYLAMRGRFEYLAIAVSLLACSLQAAQLALSHIHPFTAWDDFLLTLWLGITNVALIEFVRLILHRRRSGWLLALMIANFLGYFASNLNNIGFLASLPTAIAYFLPALIVKAVLTVMLLQGLLRGNRDARVILPAIAVVSIANYWYFFFFVRVIWWSWLPVSPLPDLQVGTYKTDFWNTWSVIYCITILLFLVLRTIGIARERARAAAELEAARAVQHVLIPVEIPAVPGFALESVYKPAGEVGGDFFQILPIHSGGVLVVIGDVSGKGMPAAMTVSLLVGTFRTLAHYTQAPSEILTAMNTRMLARSHGGFTTCLVLRADSNGTLTVANAGHIAPYLAGKELPLESGLPLGLSASATYAESTFHLAPGQQVTLVTDGVVEARDKTGALFGFDRTAAVSTQDANQIATTAELFGQEDDITTLTLIATATP